jgi:hypothetical protein
MYPVLLGVILGVVLTFVGLFLFLALVSYVGRPRVSEGSTAAAPSRQQHLDIQPSGVSMVQEAPQAARAKSQAKPRPSSRTTAWWW